MYVPKPTGHNWAVNDSVLIKHAEMQKWAEETFSLYDRLSARALISY